eukprot:CAMPEP_0168394858 /NCGR_PEP_ID=MMETSP0228-20121227/19749_1 /TAXON_ID=133427 /ORGANISM="Protoceratium reticulatum, Strain CCCM 535 (=CCMP 1889)" /LENGTH=311 /DNA_ID=CAMNT_0008408281 /DNA_START=74 /DNA_END=1009 /DNA_ORIENTATION=-
MSDQPLEEFIQELKRHVAAAEPHGGGCFSCLGEILGIGGDEEDSRAQKVARDVAVAGPAEYADRNFEVKSIKNDEVEFELGYAKTGSDIPEPFHGIHWMDQFHRSSVAQDPDWQAAVPFVHPPSDETLACFGDYPTRWNPDTRTIEQCPNYGGERGHWTFKDTATGKAQLEGSIASRMEADFVFDEAMEVAKVAARVRIPVVGAWLYVPKALFEMRMERRPWGWNRITTLGPDLPNIVDHSPLLAKVLPAHIMQILQIGEAGAFEYPVLQIVDGDGNRTKYYDEYLQFVNSATDGMQVVGVAVRPEPQVDG